MSDKVFIVEMNPEFCAANTEFTTPDGAQVTFTPRIGEDYWLARVRLHGKQAIQCFPKFFTIGCGFALESDWNTNLPLSTDAKQIFDHISHNKKFRKIDDADCVRAIELLQQTVLPVWEARKRASLERGKP